MTELYFFYNAVETKFRIVALVSAAGQKSVASIRDPFDAVRLWNAIGAEYDDDDERLSTYEEKLFSWVYPFYSVHKLVFSLLFFQNPKSKII